MLQPHVGDVFAAKEAASVRALQDPALRFVQAASFPLKAPLAGEGHLLVLHRVEAREAADGPIRRNRLALVAGGVKFNLERREPRGDDRPVALLGFGLHAATHNDPPLQGAAELAEGLESFSFRLNLSPAGRIGRRTEAELGLGVPLRRQPAFNVKL
jgi:hypothetical protein